MLGEGDRRLRQEQRGPAGGLLLGHTRQGIVEDGACGREVPAKPERPCELGRGQRDERAFAQLAAEPERLPKIDLRLLEPAGEPVDRAALAERAGELPPRAELAERYDGRVGVLLGCRRAAR